LDAKPPLKKKSLREKGKIRDEYASFLGKGIGVEINQKGRKEGRCYSLPLKGTTVCPGKRANRPFLE